MHVIAHRRNTIEELRQTPQHYGVEVDIRSHGQDLVIHHDPFSDGVLLEDWLNHYSHGTLVLNVKEEGIEYRLKKCVENRGISDYFFLDLSFPFLIKMVNTGERRIAIRYSEYESIESVLSLKNKADWVWVDCFTKYPLTQESFQILKKAEFKLCLVSPELQGKDIQQIKDIKLEFLEANIIFDAVCTKYPSLWEVIV